MKIFLHFWLFLTTFFSSVFTSSRKNIEADVKEPVAAPVFPRAPDPVVVRQDEEHASPAYMDLKRRFRDIGRLQAVAETMGRDFLTHMPEGAWKSRLSQISYLHRCIHEHVSDPEMRRQVERAQSHLSNNEEDWDEWDQANLREINRVCERSRYVDGDLTEKEARLSYEGRRQHRHVLATGDWMQGREFLTRTVDMKREIAEAICKGTGKNDMYQVLLDEYLPGTHVDDVEKWFGTMRKKLNVMVPKITEKQAKETPPVSLIDFYPAKAQMWINQALLKSVGFDFERGGLYETGHNPVEGGTPEDTRLVIRCADTTNFMDSMKSTLHEGGHGIYIQGLPRKTWRYQPVGQDMGAAVHESQALLIEMIIGRSREFYDFLAPRVEGLFHGLHNPALTAENLHKVKTRVKATANRKQADEVTYFYHVLLRFRLERELINGDLKLKDLPERWEESLEELIGLKPESHAEGCLQDVHWFVGKFGYFPAYAVGHMMAAQQYETIHKDIPDTLEHISQGNFAHITNWLGENVHRKGRLLGVEDLMKQATGAAISPDALLRHFERRYVAA